MAIHASYHGSDPNLFLGPKGAKEGGKSTRLWGTQKIAKFLRITAVAFGSAKLKRQILPQQDRVK